MSDGNINVSRVPRREQERGEVLTPAEAQRRLSQLRAAVQGDPVGWALDVGKRAFDNPDPPSLERTGVPPYLDSAPEAIRVAAQKTYARGEAERVLRATLRAELILRDHPKHANQAGWLRQWHQREWRIDHVSADLQERELQLQAALDRRYGR